MNVCQRILFAFALALSSGLAVTIDNNLPVGTPGYLEVDVGDAGELVGAGYITAGRVSSGDVIQRSQVVFEYFSYMTAGGTNVFQIGDGANVNVPASRRGSNEVYSAGNFVGEAGNTIFWEATTRMTDGNPIMQTTYRFRAVGGTFGDLTMSRYLDEDVEDGPGNDMLFIRGTAGRGSLNLYTIDSVEVYGVSHGGAYTESQGLNNATYIGWAAGSYPTLQGQIEIGTAMYDPAGNLGFGMFPSVHPLLGNGFGPVDVTSALAWRLDPDATDATVVTTFGNLATFESILPELSVQKTADRTEVMAGETVTYSLVVSNDGGAVTGILVSDTFPGNVFQSIETTGDATVDLALGQIQWVIPELIPGGSTTLTAVATIRYGVDLIGILPAGSNTVVNLASVGDDGSFGQDLVPSNNFDSASIQVFVDCRPIIEGCPGVVELGCNPLAIPSLAEIQAGLTTTGGVLQLVSASTNLSECLNTRSYDWQIVNACGTTTCSAVYNWTIDTTAPELVSPVPATFRDLAIACGQPVPAPNTNGFLQALMQDTANVSSLVVFGDSLSDVGNLFAVTSGLTPASPPYANGRFSTGPLWVEGLNNALGLPPLTPSILGGNNYAVGGALTDGHPAGPAFGVNNQLMTYIGSTGGVADPDAIYVLWAGANDLLAALSSGDSATVGAAVSAAILNIEGLVAQLESIGVQTLIVPNLPDLSLSPSVLSINDPGFSFLARQASVSFNGQLAVALAGSSIPNLIAFDTLTAMRDMINNAASFGITNTTEPYLGNIVADPATYFFTDDIHPTAPVHAELGSQVMRELSASLGVGPADSSCGIRSVDVLASTNFSSRTVFHSYLVVDQCGNSLSYTQRLSLAVDLVPPVLSGVPGDESVIGDIFCGYTVPDYGVTATDDCSVSVSVSQSPPAGSVLTGPADIEVTFSVSDDQNNVTSDGFMLSISCPLVEPSTVSGIKYEDLNGNGDPDFQPVLGPTDSPHVVFVIDTSSSTSSGFPGTAAGDRNGDGLANTIADAEILAVSTINSRLQADYPNATVTIIDFDSFARLTASTTPDGGVDAAMANLPLIGGTDYASALTLAASQLAAAGTEPSQANVIFLTDGESANDFAAELAVLKAMANRLTVIGLGSGVNSFTLTTLDPLATVALDQTQLLDIAERVTFISEVVVDMVGEPGLAGVTIYADLNSDGIRQATEPSAVTAADGSYTIFGIPPGSHLVREEVPSGTTQTGPTNGVYMIDVTGGNVFTGFDFFNQAGSGGGGGGNPGGGGGVTNTIFTGTVCAVVWEDLDNNGDPADETLSTLGLLGLRVTLQNLSDGTFVEAISGANGLVQFNGVTTGSYQIVLDPASVPATLSNMSTPDSYQFNVMDGGTLPKFRFGLLAPATAIQLESQSLDGQTFQWTTAAEANTLGYFVQRSADGISWDNVNPALVLAQGGGSYAVTDDAPLAGPSFYRLLEIETNLEQISYPALGQAAPLGGETMTLLAEAGEAELTIPEGVDSILVIGLSAGASLQADGLGLFGERLSVEGDHAIYFSWTAGSRVIVK